MTPPNNQPRDWYIAHKKSNIRFDYAFYSKELLETDVYVSGGNCDEVILVREVLDQPRPAEVEELAEKHANPMGLKDLRMPVRNDMNRLKESFIAGYEAAKNGK